MGKKRVRKAELTQDFKIFGKVKLSQGTVVEIVDVAFVVNGINQYRVQIADESYIISATMLKED